MQYARSFRFRIHLISALVALAVACSVAPAASATGMYSTPERYYQWSMVTCGGSDVTHTCPGYTLSAQNTWVPATVDAYGHGPAWTYGEELYMYPSAYGLPWIWGYSRTKGWVLLHNVRAIDPSSIALA